MRSFLNGGDYERSENNFMFKSPSLQYVNSIRKMHAVRLCYIKWGSDQNIVLKILMYFVAFVQISKTSRHFSLFSLENCFNSIFSSISKVPACTLSMRRKLFILLDQVLMPCTGISLKQKNTSFLSKILKARILYFG